MKKRGIFLFASILVAILFSQVCMAGFSDSYAYKKNITISSSKVVQNLADFPLLVSIYDSDLRNFSLDNGNDILFALDDSNKLDYQIEIFNKSYNATHAQLVAWVRVNLSSSQESVIWLYYNNSVASNQENPSGVWDLGYKGVYHLKESSGNVNDSTLNAHNSIRYGGTPDYSQAGKIGSAINFNAASNENFNFSNVADFNFANNFTVSAWIKTTQSAGSIGICGKLQHGPDIGFALQTSGGNGSMWVNGLWNISSTVVNDNTWRYLYIVREGSLSKLYIDSVLRRTLVQGATTSNPSPFYIGAWGYHMGDLYDYSGLIDEVQLSNVARSEAWMNASFDNQNSPLTFYSLGSAVSLASMTGDLLNFSNFLEVPASGSVYLLGQIYDFNVTINNSNGTGFLQFNGANYSATNLSDVFSSTISSLGAGSYNYRWFAYTNGTGNLSYSSERQYSISKAASSLSLILDNSNSDANIDEGESIDLNCSRINGEGLVYLFNAGNLINSGESIGNTTLFSTPGSYNITCAYFSTENYTSVSSTYWVNVADIENEPPVLHFLFPTFSSGEVIAQIFAEFFASIIEPNLNKFIWQWQNVNYTIYDSRLALGVNFDNNSAIGENGGKFVDISGKGNNGSCTGVNCPNILTVSRFSGTSSNSNNNNLVFLERFNSGLGNWTLETYGGFIENVTKDYSKKIMLNDTSSASYISASRNFQEPDGNWILEYDILHNSGAVGIMELMDVFDNPLISVDLGSSANTINFFTDSATASNASFNAGVYKQVILRINKQLGIVNAYLSENDGTYGSLSAIGSTKSYSGNPISKIKFRTGDLQTGAVYLDEIKIYKPVLAVIGDSITDGKPRWSTHPAYPSGRLSSASNESSPPNQEIGERLCTNCWIANRAFGGTTTSGVDGKIQSVILDQNFTQVYLSIGHNDIMNSVSLETMKSNFNSTINKILAVGINGTNILIGNVFPSGYFNTQAKKDQKTQWNEWLYNLSRDLEAVYVDLNSALKDPSNPDQIIPGLSDDGTHLYPAGNDILAQAVVDAISNSSEIISRKSLSLNGSSSISFGNSSSLDFEELSVFSWINFSGYGNSSILAKGNSYKLGTANGKIYSRIIVSGSNLEAVTSESYNDGKWHSVAFTYNQSLLSLYVDGELKAVNSSSGPIEKSSDNLTVGSNGTGEFFVGYIDDIMIYNYSLAGLESTRIMSSEFRKINLSDWRFYINESNLGDGIYYYRISGSDVSENENSSEIRNITISYDTTPPVINLISPESKTYGINTSLPLNFSVSDSRSTIDSCWYSLDNGANITLNSCQNTTFNASEGVHIIYFYANDSAGNFASINRSFSVSTAIAVALIKPENNKWSKSREVEFNYTVLTSSKVNNCSLWIDNGVWHLNKTNSSFVNTSEGINKFSLNLSDGVYRWNVLCTGDYQAFALSNFTLNVDSVLPVLEIIYPSNNTLFLQNVSIGLNFSVSESNLDSCWYSLDEGKINMSIACQAGQNNLSFGYKTGSYNLSVYANDSAGNQIRERVYNLSISKDVIAPSLSLTEPIGTKNSKTGIPLKFLVSDNVDSLNELSCWFNVTYSSTGGSVSGLENVIVSGCFETGFSVPSDAGYLLYFSARDRTGNLNVSNSSFSVDTSSVVVIPQGPGGGGGSGGGSSGPAPLTLNKTQNVSVKETYGINISDVFDVVANPGESKTLSVKVKNSGTAFLNNCKLVGTGNYASWIKGKTMQGLSSGQSEDFIVSLSVPQDAAPDTDLKIVVLCDEENKSAGFKVSLVRSSLELEIKNMIQKRNIFNFVYDVRDELGLEQNMLVEYWLSDYEDKKVVEGRDSFELEAGKTASREVIIEIPSKMSGEYKLNVKATSDKATSFKQETVILGKQAGVIGRVVSGESGQIVYIAFFVILSLAAGFFIVRRIIKRAYRPESSGYVKLKLGKCKQAS